MEAKKVVYAVGAVLSGFASVGMMIWAALTYLTGDEQQQMLAFAGLVLLALGFGCWLSSTGSVTINEPEPSEEEINA